MDVPPPAALPQVIPPQLPIAEPEIQLSEEQEAVLAMVRAGKNVFFTGPAGTGKSVLLREIIKVLRSCRSGIAVTASTGIAGLNIGGSTVHSFAGIGLGKEPAESLAFRIKNSRRLRERWTFTRTLIIDEISMLDGILFDKLEYIARDVRDSDAPFGGMQLVLSGDFCQLPPVPDESHKYRMPATFAFDAVSWPACISKPVILSRVFRQKDNAFVDILSSMRVGVLTDQHIAQLMRLTRPLIYADGIEPSYLFPLRSQVDHCNTERLNALPAPEHTYLAVDNAGFDVHNHHISKEGAAKLLDRLVAKPDISLRLGAQVMLIQNIEQGTLVNGSVGRVVEFLTTREAIERNIEVAVPGLRAVADPQRHLWQSLNENVFLNKQPWPLVRFTSGRDLLCAPLEFSVQGFRGNIEAHRLQVPLILAWSISIHKSQGQTLARVKVDLARIFEKGQAYVALSRATTMEHLQIENFSPSRVQVHPRVLAWQRTWMTTDPKPDPDPEPMKPEDAWEDEMDSEEALAHFWGPPKIQVPIAAK